MVKSEEKLLYIKIGRYSVLKASVKKYPTGRQVSNAVGYRGMNGVFYLHHSFEHFLHIVNRIVNDDWTTMRTREGVGGTS